MSQTLSYILGLATVLLVLALTTPYWQTAAYDAERRVHTFAGLWHQVLQIGRPDGAICRGKAEKTCRTVSSVCTWDESEGYDAACRGLDAVCGRIDDEQACGVTNSSSCHWREGACRAHDDVTFDMIMPYGSTSADHTAIVTARTMSIVSAAFGLVALMVNGMPAPRPMLVAMLAGVATLTALTLLIVYATQISSGDGKNTYSLSHNVQTQLPDIFKNPHNKTDDTYHLKMHYQSWGFYATVLATVLLALATVLGITQYRRMK
tara:strand:+ start:1477 stop:2265 length:789 start_codon:yes stop_codon:yes gene_type:complete